MENQSKWISVYIFHQTSFEKIINELIKLIIEDLELNGFISKYFFIRYWENGSHLRLRILPKNGLYAETINEKIIQLTNNYFEKQNNEMSYRLEFSEYIRELDRYGGIENIENAEKIFDLSSRIVINMIEEKYLSWEYSLAISNAIKINLLFAKCFFSYDRKLIIDFFKKIYSNWLYYSIKLDGDIIEEEVKKINLYYEKSYQKQKFSIKILVNSIFNFHFEIKNKVSWDYECEMILKNNFFSIETFEKKYILYDSLIHMNNNRLGIHNRDESFIAYLIFNCLEDL